MALRPDQRGELLWRVDVVRQPVRRSRTASPAGRARRGACAAYSSPSTAAGSAATASRSVQPLAVLPDDVAQPLVAAARPGCRPSSSRRANARRSRRARPRRTGPRAGRAGARPAGSRGPPTPARSRSTPLPRRAGRRARSRSAADISSLTPSRRSARCPGRSAAGSTRNTRIIGNVAITEPANSRFHDVRFCTTNSASPTGAVYFSGSDHHDQRPEEVLPRPLEGEDRVGRQRRRRTAAARRSRRSGTRWRRRSAPPRAVSSGIDSMYCRSRKIPKARHHAAA